VPPTRLPLSPGYGNIYIRTQLIDGERFAHGIHTPEALQQRAELFRLNAVYFDIPILGTSTH
jgi:hypothetical protein